MTGLEPLFVGALLSPPGLVLAPAALLVAVLLGRVLLGVAWKLLLIALAVAVSLWLVGVVRTVLVAV